MESLESEITLNAQEKLILELIRKKHTTNEIAKIMKISHHTVKSHIYKIKRMTLK